MIKLCPLRSGSSGNAILAFTEKTKLLIDCGVSGKAVFGALDEIGITPSEIDAILVTHEHIDHSKGVGVVSRKLDIPIYANSGTWLGMECSSVNLGKLSEKNVKVIKSNSEFEIGDIAIKPFEIPHDANEPVGYRLNSGNKQIAVATDMGRIDDSVYETIKGSSIVLLESNYDLNMLNIGDYPYHLKQRIKGKFGHLCNEDAGEFAVKLANTGTKNIVLGHLSNQNNYPELAFETVKSILEEYGIIPNADFGLSVAKRSAVSGVYSA